MSPTPGRYHHTNLNEMATTIPEDQLGNGHQAVEIALRDVPDDVDEMQITVNNKFDYYDIHVTWVEP